MTDDHFARHSLVHQHGELTKENEKLQARIAELEAENKYLTELNADVYVQGVERGEAKSAAQIAEMEFRIERLKRCLSIHVMPAHADEINKEW